MKGTGHEETMVRGQPPKEEMAGGRTERRKKKTKSPGDPAVELTPDQSSFSCWEGKAETLCCYVSAFFCFHIFLPEGSLREDFKGERYLLKISDE